MNYVKKRRGMTVLVLSVLISLLVSSVPTYAVGTDYYAVEPDGTTAEPGTEADDQVEKPGTEADDQTREEPDIEAGGSTDVQTDRSDDQVEEPGTEADDQVEEPGTEADDQTQEEPDARADAAETDEVPGEADEPVMGAEAAIEDGWYRIASCVDPNYVLDVAGGSTDIKANIQLYPNNGTAAQIFYVRRQEDGSYTLQNRKSSHYLNVAHGSKDKGANIWQYRDDGTEAMRFRIEEGETEGSVKIVSVLSGLPLDVKDGRAVRKANVRLWRDNGTRAQRWQFIPVPPKEAASVKSGYYTLTNASAPQVLDIKAASQNDKAGTQIHKSNGTAAQTFYIEAGSDGTCTLMACCSGYYLMPQNGTLSAGSAVIQSGPASDEAQKWRLYNVGGYLQIACAGEDGLVMGVRGGNGSSSKDVVLQKAADGTGSAEETAQLWQYTAVSEPQITPAAGLYTIRAAGQTRYVLDVDNGSTGTANVRLHHANGTDAQKFLLMPNGSGTFTIENIGSFMALDVKGAGTADGTNVQQHAANKDSSAQVWTFRGCPGRYRLISACGNKALTAQGAIAENSNLMISSDKGTATQLFALEKAVTSAAPLDRQFYRLTPAHDTTKAIDVPDAGFAEGLLMRIHTSNYTDAQKWQFISTGDGYYVIMNVLNGLCLTAKAYGGNTWGAVKRTTVIQYNEIEGNSYKKYQKWKPVPSGDGGYYLMNAGSGLYLDVKGGSAAQNTPLQVYPGNQTAAQKFYLTRVTTSCYIRWHDYATDSRGVRHWLEGTFWDDPKVSDVDFMAAAIYTEGGSQGLAGMMMIGYTMLNRGSISDLRYTIYEYGQYQICRDGALTRILRAISTGNTGAYGNLDTARAAARACAAGSAIRLSAPATMTYPGGQRSLQSGTMIGRKDFAVYNGFMTPAAWGRHGFSTANKHTITYLGHIYYVTAEVW